MTPVIATVAGAMGSFCLLLYTGRRNPSWLLMALFSLWVLSPFALTLWTHFSRRRWQTLDAAAVVIAILSPAIYGYTAFRPPRPQGVFAFVVTPAVSWLFIGITALL